MATSPQTKNDRADEDPDLDDRPRANGQRGEDAGAQVIESARQAAVETTDAMGQLVRQGQDGARRSVAMWTEMMIRLTPFAQLNPFAQPGFPGQEQAEDDEGRVEAPVFPAQAWAEGLFDMFETALVTQRRMVDQVLITQRQLVGQLLDTGAGLAASQAATVRDRTTAGLTRR